MTVAGEDYTTQRPAPEPCLLLPYPSREVVGRSYRASSAKNSPVATAQKRASSRLWQRRSERIHTATAARPWATTTLTRPILLEIPR
jgi:hypothetical protein